MRTLDSLARITLTLALGLWISPATTALAQQSFTLPDDVAERTADIYSEGTRLTAHIFTPMSASADEPLPAIVMAQGWGGRQSSLFRDAAEFAQAGYYVLTFDFRGWGESDSRVILTEPMPDHTARTLTAEVRAVREVMDPSDMGQDWLNVLHWIHGEPQVDTDNIGVWGSSMAGGLAVWAAGNDTRVKAVHSQVTGTLDGRVSGTSEDALETSARRARGEIGYPEPRERYGTLNGAPIHARFTPYVPSEALERNPDVALQVVLAEEEQYGGNPRAIELYEGHEGPKNLVIIPGIGHYDIYTGARQQAHRLAQAWFDRYLKATGSAGGGWRAPTTPHGDPDLQGSWTNVTLTPFERPRGQGPVLSAEQAAAIESGRAAYVAAQAAPTDPDRPVSPSGGADFEFCSSPTGCYNEVFTARGDRVAVVDGEYRSSLVTEPPDGRVPELTPEGRARVGAYRAAQRAFGPYDHPELRPLGERCLASFGSSAGPPMVPNNWYNNNYTIVQTPDHVLIMTEMVHDARIIPLGVAPPVDDGLRPWFGQSRGHWEGSTLVIETTNLHPDQVWRGAPPSEELRVVERLTRVDEDTVLYEFTIDDPSTYTQPWGGQIPFERFDDQLYEYACHEGNYSLQNVLSGARYQERLETGEESIR